MMVNVRRASVLGFVVVVVLNFGARGRRGRFEISFGVVPPLVVNFGMERDFLHEEGGEESEAGDGDANFPCLDETEGRSEGELEERRRVRRVGRRSRGGRTKKLKRVSESGLNSLLKDGILDVLDSGDDGVDDLETLRELGEEGSRKRLAELVLERSPKRENQSAVRQETMRSKRILT